MMFYLFSPITHTKTTQNDDENRKTLQKQFQKSETFEKASFLLADAY